MSKKYQCKRQPLGVSIFLSKYFRQVVNIPCFIARAREPLCLIAALIFISSCTTLRPITDTSDIIYKQAALTEEEVKIWPFMDIRKDSIPGINLYGAYDFLKNREGIQIIAGVIDSGIDIEHKDLKKNVWINDDEISGNQVDDDQNGYVDDTLGWNFLGNKMYDMLYAPYAISRIVARHEYNQRKGIYNYDSLLQEYEMRSTQVGEQYARFTALDMSSVPEGTKKYFQHLEAQAMYHYNLYYDPREVYIGDDPHDWSDQDYGNPNIIGFKDKESHGTHVTGILAAISRNETIIPIRTIPDGDEYDKDVALAIRYAVDNGAKVVNMSFGKGYSEHADWVQEAIQYAAVKDVLLIHAAGNDQKNIDLEDNFPSDNKDGVEIANNVITVGATTRYFNEKLVSEFSNYGRQNVDIFAPGSHIYSTLPNNEYGFQQGTSMAAPAVAGVAVLIRSYYPELTAIHVKKIIMDSGIEVPFKVIVPGTNEMKPFTELCQSGRILNAYNALLMAHKISKGI